MSFGEKIKAFRLSTKLSQKNFAELIGVPYRTYQTIEQGGTERIEVSALNKLSSMGIDLANLLLDGDANIVPRETQYQLTDSGAETKTGPATREAAEAELLLTEFGAWVRRTVLKSPELTDDIATGIRRLINEVEDKRLPRAAPQDEQGNKAAS